MATITLETFNKTLQDISTNKKHKNELNKNIDKAYDLIPEFYFKNKSPILKIRINDNLVKCIVDTGAESSIISKKIMNKCGLNNIIDKECKGSVIGVGKGSLIGRIHYVELWVSKTKFIAVSLLVIDNSNFDMLIGVDILRNHNAIINFSNNTIHFGNEKLKLF